MTISVRQGTAKDGGFIIKSNIHITRRELEILALIGMGLDNHEAAERLFVSVNTVRNHIWNLMKKLEQSIHRLIITELMFYYNTTSVVIYRCSQIRRFPQHF